MNIKCKLFPAVFITPVMFAVLLYTGMTFSYDGDIDYLAPYVTLDPESGKLITVDPRKDAAAAAKLEQQHNASNPNATASITTSTTATTAATNETGAAPTTMSSPASQDQMPAPATSSRATVIAIGTFVFIGLIVAFTRRKSGNATDTSASG